MLKNEPTVHSLSTLEGGLKDNETFLTQRAGKLIQIPKLAEKTPQFQEIHGNGRTLQSTLLIQKKKEMAAVQLLLEKKRLEFSKRMEECRGKQEELRAKQKQIRDRVVKFEKFLKENDAKRQRATLKATTEKRLKEIKEQEIAELHKQLVEEQNKSENILNLIKKYEKHEQYLQLVVDSLPPDYLEVHEPHVNDILMRHKTLVETNSDLQNMVRKIQDQTDAQQRAFQELMKEKNDKILVYNSTLGTYQKSLDRIKQESAYHEQKQEAKDQIAKERMRLLSEAKFSINNLYERVISRSVMKKTKETQLEINHFAHTSEELAIKLKVVEERTLDLQHIAMKAEEYLAEIKT